MKTEVRFNLTDFEGVYVYRLNQQTPSMLDVLVQIQNARFDKKHSGEGLSIQEDAELLAINEILNKIL